MSTAPRPAVTPQAVVGVSICLMGIALTLDNLGLYEFRSIIELWPVVPISIGVLTLMYGESKQDYLKGTFWLALGTFFMFRPPFIREIWPILLVILGGYLVWRSRSAPQPKRKAADEQDWDNGEYGDQDDPYINVQAYGQSAQQMPPTPDPFTGAPAANPVTGQDAAPAAQAAGTTTGATGDPSASTASSATGMPPGVPPPIPEDYRRHYKDARDAARDAVREAKQAAREALREVRGVRRRSGPFGCGPRKNDLRGGWDAGAPAGTTAGAPGAAPGTGPQFARPRPGTGQRPALFAFMAGVRRQVSGAFAGGEATAVMGGVELDLRYAAMDGDEVTIDTFALWGGIEIWVPPHWNIVSQGLPLMGAFEDKTHVTNPGQGPRLIIRGVAVMGGVEIKN